ncbi:uncharacterized protein LAJ45_10612 [Morchella importuna]|uniref:uncharacterized protein n=1 Tax=Morchella importuna TaxID=1174673 RepID=UPI001E8D96EE|nr:uncharacterized protein LAJ45_10612 [Morchella importuna]KAH8145332.1 hypothetical protein LAJ45_10612 [Morchella importuna]
MHMHERYGNAWLKSHWISVPRSQSRLMPAAGKYFAVSALRRKTYANPDMECYIRSLSQPYSCSCASARGRSRKDVVTEQHLAPKPTPSFDFPSSFHSHAFYDPPYR